jgi:hypothetical protein
LKALENTDYVMLFKFKKLIRLIATSFPFTSNVPELIQKTGISRPSLLRAFDLSERTRILQSLHKPNSGIGALTKPEKLYLSNTNLAYALCKENVNVGSLRETFFVNQLRVSSQINPAPKSDFLIDENFTFETGGKNKGGIKIQGIPSSFIVKDDIEYGVGTIIPLWLFGFLY